jgi:hypothetical protein
MWRVSLDGSATATVHAQLKKVGESRIVFGAHMVLPEKDII